MIGALRGTLLDVSTRGEVLVDVHGVGYRVTVTPATLAALGELGGAVFLHVHTHVREDAITLYGFAGRDERVCFEVLLGTHGVGPALALAILGALTPDRLREAVDAEDGDALTTVPGVGKKTAARLLIELKSKLDGADFGPGGRTGGLPPRAAAGSGAGDARHDVRVALAELGFQPEEVRRVLRQLPHDDGADAAALLRQALALVGARP